MRVNVKKFTILLSSCLAVWLVISYTSFNVISKFISDKETVIDVVRMEARIEQLEKQMDLEISESNNLLQKLKVYIKKTSEMKSAQEAVRLASSGAVLPVLVIACNRVTIKRCLDNLIKFRPNKDTFPIIVSQDCSHNETYNVIKEYTLMDPSIGLVLQPDQSPIILPKAKIKFRGYYKIARHYRFALNYVFRELQHEAVIIIEDDLDISPDFFEYFQGTYSLLKKDPSLWCISAWNDNGKKELIDMSRPELLHRTDFFPGLGWMLQRESWLDLDPHWPEAFFDDWLRNPENTHGRSCIRPEVSRTYSFGKVGVSKGLFFDMHLRYIRLNQDYVPFTQLNLTYLIKDIYDAQLEELVYSLPEMSADDVAALGFAEGESAVRIPYKPDTFRITAKKLGLMDDFRSGIPRTAYRGIVSCFYRGHRVYIAPQHKWTKYDPMLN